MEEEKKVLKNEDIVPTSENKVNKPVKNNNGLIAFLIVIILLLAAALVYFVFFNKKEEPKKENNTEEKEQKQEEEETKEETEPKGDYTLDVYVTTWDVDGQIFGEKTEGAKKVTIKVETPKAKFVSSSNDRTANFFIYEDNGLKLYDLRNNKSTKLNLNNVYKDYYLNLSEDEKSVVGISCNDKNNYGSYYNIKLGKELYKGKYKLADDWYIVNAGNKYLSTSTKNKTYLLSATEEKVIMSFDEDADEYWKHVYTYFGENGNNVYALEHCFDDGCVINKLYNSNLKEFFSGEISGESEFALYKKNIYIKDKNTIKKFNMNGDIQTTNNYDKVLGLVNNYVFIVKEGSAYIENIDDKTESKEICTWDDNWDFDSFTSGYYDRKTLDAMNEKNKEPGIYFVFYYGYDKEGNVDRDGRGNYGMEYCYTEKKEFVEYAIKQEMGGRGKPVLYLYPEKETNVKVTFLHPEYLTTTYPKYINSWNVTVKPNGDIMDKDGKYYYALYWDEKRYDEKDFSTGFYVESKDAINFLEEKLTIIGLNDRERNEFIMYWLPIMEKNGKNLVYFELTKEREFGNKLIIEPKPDSMLRVSIHVKKVNEKVNIKEEKLETFKRTGFTVVEWGGMTY